MAEQGNGTPDSGEDILNRDKVAPNQFEELVRGLRASNLDRQALHRLLHSLFEEVGRDALHCIEELLPHTKGDNSPNAQRFLGYRHRMLNSFNGASRQAMEILRDFCIHQVYERKVVAKVVTRGQGPYNLPAWVKMPHQKPRPQGGSDSTAGQA